MADNALSGEVRWKAHTRDFVDDRTKDRWLSLLKESCRHAQVGRQMEPRLVAGKESGVRRALRGGFSRSSQVSIHLEANRETTLGQEDVDRDEW